MPPATTADRPAVRFQEQLEIPAGIAGLQAFRRWLHSPGFPERGRIDYVGGTIEVDMSPEHLQTHGSLKARLATYIQGVADDDDLGQVFIDRARLTSAGVGLSAEPDVLLVTWAALRAGRARYVSSSPDAPDRVMEIEGSVDLVVEVVSDSSVGKDTLRLPPLYGRAGVRELWVVDARGPAVELSLRRLCEGAHEEVSPDEDGYRESRVLGRSVRIRREAGPVPHTFRYVVDERRAG